MNTVPLAISLLVLREDKMILAISRKDDPDDFGLPGGKVDPGESPEEAIVRETKEETGLIIRMVTPVFTRISEGGSSGRTYLNITYVAGDYGTSHEDINEFMEAGVQGENPKQQKGEGRLAWIPPQLLCIGRFGRYNTAMLKSMCLVNKGAPSPQSIMNARNKIEDVCDHAFSVGGDDLCSLCDRKIR